ncbi:MAG: hypothetical protein COA67_06025 [Lutibacter sp.]|nr:MAG: hypothetical protein COA67_06025 [Lutibacter sp.]
MENSDNKLVTLLSSIDLYELEITKGKLESEGIQCFITGKADTIGFADGYRLQIASSDQLKAKDILNKIN